MGVVSYRLIDDVEEALAQTFQADYHMEGAVIFQNQGIKHDDFTLFIEFVENEEIVQIAEMLEEVYRKFPPSMYSINLSSEPAARHFNQHTKESADFVRTVLNLEGSALHKLLLLTSGNFMLSDENADLVTALAKAKPEFVDDPLILDRSHNLYNGLKDFYILPTIAVHTMMSADRPLFIDNKNPLASAANKDVWPFYLGLKSRDSLDFIVRLMTFMVTENLNLTFFGHLQIDFNEVAKTNRTISGFSVLHSIQDLLLSENYKTLAASMTIAELFALTMILPNESYRLKIPTGIIRRRAREIAKNEVAYARGPLNSVSCYLSDEELSKITGFGTLKVFDNFLQGTSIAMEVPAVIYACFAEAIVAKGTQQALDILRECPHVRFMDSNNLKAYEATAALIGEYLNSKDDLPFGWFAQMSEHSWVLSSHLQDKEHAEML